MERIQCEVSESPGALEDVRAAVARCREVGAELELVGIVKTSMFDAPQPAFGERVRRFNQVQHRLKQAAGIARSAGITPNVSLPAGGLEQELPREAEAMADVESVLGRPKGRIRAALERPAPLRPSRWL
jgi:hypothetical protein